MNYKTDKIRMRAFVFVALTFILSSCGPVPCGWNSGYKQLDKEPPRSSIVGLYQLNQSSKDYLKENYREWPIKLEINNDGYYNFINALNVKTGRWSVSCSESYACLLELEGITVEPFSEKNGMLAIQITIGDGDECAGIIYEKLEN
jgi:hypothetical protein